MRVHHRNSVLAFGVRRGGGNGNTHFIADAQGRGLLQKKAVVVEGGGNIT